MTETYIHYLLHAGVAISLVWLLLSIRGSKLRIMPVLLLLCLASVLIWRGWQIQYIPLTNKLESFVGFVCALAGTSIWHGLRSGRSARTLAALTSFGFLTVALFFDRQITYPSPLLITVWYLLHVPLSFVAYAFWIQAGGDAIDQMYDDTQRVLLHENMRLGFFFFSLAMVFGALWGVVSWGVYFLWDTKVLWSLASWVYFATVLHMWPLARQNRALYLGLGLAGVLIVLITYIGTSFMTGSIHSF